MKELVVCGNTQWYSELVKSLEDDVQPVLVLQLYMSVMCVVWILSPIFINNKIILVANIVLWLEQYCLQKRLICKWVASLAWVKNPRPGRSML